MIAHTPKIITKIFFNLVWNLPNDNKNVHITFDDGPIPETTPWILEKLKEYNAKATFFCVGNNVRKHPELFDAIINDGHTVGNHTYNHTKGWSISNEKYFEDVKKADSLINSNLFRPPHGQITPFQAKVLKKKYKIIMWDVLSMDYDKNQSKKKCTQNVINNVSSGSVVVFHDSTKAKRNMQYSLSHTLDFLSNNGFSSKSIKIKPAIDKNISTQFELIPAFAKNRVLLSH